MLTPSLLQQRLASWSTKLSLQIPKADTPPIVLYQALFAMVHDLKTSVGMSDDQRVSGLTPVVLNADAILRKLAHGELELPAEDNRDLYHIAIHLDSIATLVAFLTRTEPRGTTLEREELPIFTRSYPWESLSKARARCATRSKLTFFETATQIHLSGLLKFEDELRATLIELDGVAIVRKVEPVAGPSGGSMQIEVTQLAAFPRPAKLADSEWRQV